MEAGHVGRLWSLEGLMWAATAIILQHGTAGPNLEERAAVEEGAEWKAGEAYLPHSGRPASRKPSCFPSLQIPHQPK